MRIKLTEIVEGTSKADVADQLRKAANEISPIKPERTGSRRFPMRAGREIFEHFDKQFKKTIDDIKADIERILG